MVITHINNDLSTKKYSTKALNNAAKSGIFESLGKDTFVSEVSFNGKIHDYAQEGNLKALKIRLLFGININSQNKSGLTPLACACKANKIDIIDELLKHSQVDVNKPDEDGNTPLIHACKKSYLIVKKLLQHPNIDVNKTDNDNFAPLHFACYYDTTYIAKELLKHPGIDVNISGKRGETPLIYACKGGDLTIVQELLKHPNIDVNKANYNDWTPLNTACYSDRLSIVNELLKCPGIDVNKPNQNGYTPLLSACNAKHLSIVKELLKHPDIDINKTNKNGYTPLNLACYNKSVDIVKELLKHPNTDVNKTSNENWVPLLMSSYNGGKDIVEMLLDREDIDVNIKNDEGKTALMIAVCRYEYEIMNLLLEHPDIDTTIKDKNGKTALDYMRYEKNSTKYNILKALTEYQLEHPETVGKGRKKPPVDVSKLSPEENIWTEEEITKRFTKLVTDQDYDKALDMLDKTPLINLDEKLLNKICSTGNAKFAEKVFDYKHNQKPMLEEYEQKRKVFMDETIKNISYEELKENNVALSTLDGFKILVSRPEFNPNDSYEKRTLFERACILDPEGNLASSILSKYDDVIVDNAKKTRNTTIKSLIANYEKEGKFKVKLENIKSKLSSAQTREAAVESLNDFVSSDEFKPEMTDSVGNDVLHIIAGVASDGSREIIQKILDKGGDVDSINIGKQTPIMSAIKGLMIAKTEDEKSGLLSNIKFLLDKGADVDAQDLNDQTVFHYVCRTLSVALLMMFLTKSPNVFIRDKYGNRAAKYLQSKEMQDVYQKYIMG